MDEFISPRQAAKLMDCSKRHIYDLIARNKIKAFRAGIVRIYRSSFEEYLKRNSTEIQN